MKQFRYTIKDEIGIHARPAGLLAKKAREYRSNVSVECREKRANATKLMAIMGMGIKYGDVVTVTIEGVDEEIAAKELECFFSENL